MWFENLNYSVFVSVVSLFVAMILAVFQVQELSFWIPSSRLWLVSEEALDCTAVSEAPGRWLSAGFVTEKRSDPFVKH